MLVMRSKQGAWNIRASNLVETHERIKKLGIATRSNLRENIFIF